MVAVVGAKDASSSAALVFRVSSGSLSAVLRTVGSSLQSLFGLFLTFGGKVKLMECRDFLAPVDLDANHLMS